MTKELKQKWIDALRGGEYEQGYGALKDKDKYCCLGVLCQVGGIKLNSGVGLNPEGHNFLNKLGIIKSTFYSLNDNKEFNFNQIADWIEENVTTTD